MPKHRTVRTAVYGVDQMLTWLGAVPTGKNAERTSKARHNH